MSTEDMGGGLTASQMQFLEDHGDHKRDWKHMYEWGEAIARGHMAEIRILKKRIKVLEGLVQDRQDLD